MPGTVTVESPLAVTVMVTVTVTDSDVIPPESAGEPESEPLSVTGTQ